MLWGAVKVFRDATDHLMDRELATDERQKIVDAVLADANIRNVHELKTHASGPRLHIQMHVDLDPDQTLEAAHEIVDAAEARVREAFPTADVIIHPDPEGRAETHEVFAPEAPSATA
jgi:divalent metal cation (Fe/Co/Zn/Cd) transporter